MSTITAAMPRQPAASARARSRRLPGRVGVAATAAVAAAVLAACGSAAPAGHTTPASPATHPPTHRASPPAGAAGFRVVSMTFVSDDRGFALGSVPCGSRRCAALLGTADGGRHWVRLTPPTRTLGETYSTCTHGSPCVQQVRFATPAVGYAFSPALLMTTDGGRRWRLLAARGVSSLEAAGGTVVRVAAPYEGCTGAPYQVQSALAGSNTWHALPAPPVEMICPPVLYRQGSRLVLAGYGNPAGGVRATARIERSADGGATWAAGPDQCGGRDGYASAVTLAPPSTLVMVCQHQMPARSGAYRPAWIRVSADDGRSFGPDRQVPSAVPNAKGAVTGYQVAAASSRRILICETGTRGSLVLFTADGGRRWATALDTRGALPVVLVGYQDPRTARVAAGNLVWTTRNGGRTWRADRFIAP